MWLIVFERQRVGKADCRSPNVRPEIRHRCVDFARLPDVILITEEVEIRLDALEKMEESTGNTLML
jgi:hypothetical protein